MSLVHQYISANGSVIICDTMIWRRGIPENIKNNFPFAATWLSVYELFKTKEKKPGIIIKTWERIRDDSVYIIPLMPAQHLDFYLSKGKAIDSKYLELRKSEAGLFDNILSRKKANILPEEDWNKFLDAIESHRASYIKDFNLWIDQINTFKKEHKPVEGREDYEEKKELIEFKKAFLRTEDGIQHHWEKATLPLLQTFLSEGYKPILSEFSKFELFINVFNRYIIDLDLGAYTPTVNDLIDVFNMIYVTPTDKYWTTEKKWIDIINDLGLTKYLFDPALSEV